MIETLSVIGFLFVLMSCVLIYYSNIHWSIKATSFSLMIVFGITVYEFYKKTLGTPVEGYPTVEYVYVNHEVKSNKEVVLWIKSKDDDLDRLYRFPYSREIAKELERAKKQKEEGQEQTIEVREGENQTIGIHLDDWQGLINLIPKQ